MSFLLFILLNLPHNLNKAKLIDLIERTSQREGSYYLARNDRTVFGKKTKTIHAWSCQNVCDVLTFLLAYAILLDNISIRFGTKLYDKLYEFQWALIERKRCHALKRNQYTTCTALVVENISATRTSFLGDDSVAQLVASMSRQCCQGRAFESR